MLKTILIGFGNIAANYADDIFMQKWFKYSTHLQVLRDHPEFYLKAIVDENNFALNKAKSLGNIPEVKQNIDELDDPEEFEVAILAIPPEDRLKIMNKLPKIKAIIFEKPLANNISDAQDIIDLCQKKRIIAEVNFPRRFDEKVLANKNKLQNDLGQLQSAFGIYGNGLNNNGSHLLDLTRMLIGDCIWAQSLANGLSDDVSPIKNDFNIPFALGFKNGVKLFVQFVKFENYREVYLDLWGTKGRLSFLQEGLVSAYSSLKRHRFSEYDNELENDNRLISLMDQSNAMYNLYDFLNLKIKNKDFSNKNLIHSLEVIEIIKKIEVSFFRKDERIFL